MLETMYEERGIGLAAVQVAVLKQLVVVDLKSGEEDISLREPRIFVNPRIVERSGETISEEGCLSVTEFRAEVKRSESIKLEYQDLQGNPRLWKQMDFFPYVFSMNWIISRAFFSSIIYPC